MRTKCETGAREAPPDVGLHLVFRRPRVSGCRLCERFALPRYEARMANRGRDLGRDAKGTLCGGDDEAEEPVKKAEAIDLSEEDDLDSLLSSLDDDEEAEEAEDSDDDDDEDWDWDEDGEW